MEDEENTLKKQRETNFELLRIIAMLMVVILHYLNHSDTVLRLDEETSFVRIAGSAVQCLCIVAVNVWVLISGYFLSDAEYRLKRILIVIAEVYFYTVGVTAVMLLTSSAHIAATDSVYKAVQFLLPFESEHYWFATAYLFMVLFSPILNAGIRMLDRRQMKVTILGLLVWFSLIRSFVPVNLVTDDYGYGFGWFMTLYLIAAYIRRYDVAVFSTKGRSLLVYLGSVCASFVIRFVIYAIHTGNGGLKYYFTMPVHYNFVFCLTGALGLFQFFRYIQIPESVFARVVRFVAPFTFGVYLLHEHLEVRERWVGWMESLIGNVPRENAVLYLLHLAASVCIVFAAGIFIDWIRSVIFAFLMRVMHGTRFAAFIRNTDAALRTKREGGKRWYDR